MKNYKRTGVIVKGLVFVVCFLSIFSYLNELTIRKSLAEPWDMTNKIGGFYNEEKNSFDVIFLGSSHAYASFIPSILEDDMSLHSYVFASQLQPITATYHYFKEILKTQKPKLVVVEVFTPAFDYELDEGVVHSFTDDIPLSFNKVQMIYHAVPESLQKECFIPMIKYHVRWEELDERDWNFKRSALHDDLSGYVRLQECNQELEIVDGDLDKVEAIDKKNEKYLLKIIDLAKENDIQLLFVKTPTTDYADYQAKVNYIRDLAAKYDVPFVDFNVGSEGYKADIRTDFYDKRHLNEVGARRFTKAFEGVLRKVLE